MNHLNTHANDLFMAVKACVEPVTLFRKTDNRQMVYSVP